jgi:hypothetical protein
MLAVCTQCKKTIVVDAPGWNHCKYCQQQVWVPDPLDPEAAPSPQPAPELEIPRQSASSAGVPPASQPVPLLEIPWESSEPGHGVRRFFATLGVVLFQSRRIFADLPNTPRSRQLILYGTLILTAGLFVYFQVQALSLSLLESAIRSGSNMPSPGPWVTQMVKDMAAQKMDARFFVLSSFLSPIMAWILLAVSHQLFAIWYYLARRRPVPIHRLQRLVSYSYTPWLFIALPLIGILWFLVIQYRAVRQGLELSRPAAILLITVNLLIINLLMQFWVALHALLLR